MEKPTKKTDQELWKLIAEKISNGSYVFLKHAKERAKDRSIIDIEVINILTNKVNCNRRRNKRKDIYKPGHQDWCYCIEGDNIDEAKIRIIISFDNEFMLVITVIRLEN